MIYSITPEYSMNINYQVKLIISLVNTQFYCFTAFSLTSAFLFYLLHDTKLERSVINKARR